MGRRADQAPSAVSGVTAAATDDQRVRRVLLATDFAPVSNAATDEAIEAAARLGAALLVLSVVDPGALRLPGGSYGSRVDQVRARLEASAQAIVERARDRGIAANFLIWEGEPAEAILEAAQAESADLIVLGSHGRGPLGRLLFGSVSERVGREARCPVVVVPNRAADGPVQASS